MNIFINIVNYFLILLALACNLYAGNVEDEVITWLKEVEPNLNIQQNDVETFAWKYKIESNENNVRRLVKAKQTLRLYRKNVAKSLSTRNYENFKNLTLKRQISLLCKLGYDALEEDEIKELSFIIHELKKNKICDHKNRRLCGMDLYSNISKIIATSRDPEVLQSGWLEWHDLYNTQNVPRFRRYLELSQKAALSNNYQTKADMVTSSYNNPNLDDDLRVMYYKFMPYYEQLHAFVRYYLKSEYDNLISHNGPLPIHLLGNMYGNDWRNIVDLLGRPSGNSSFVYGITKTPFEIFKIVKWGKDFLKSINIHTLKKISYSSTTSIFLGETIKCSPSFHVFSLNDIRIHICDKMTPIDKTFQLVGDIVTKMLQRNQPFVYRKSEIPEMDELLGKVLQLSTASPNYLQRVGLLKGYENDINQKVKYLFQKSLEIFPLLSSGYSMMQYRFDLYRGVITEDINGHFWKYRLEYEGLLPPVSRSEENFDAGARINFITTRENELKNFLAMILQFQVFRSACVVAKKYDPNDVTKSLQDCDLYGDQNIGNKFTEALSLGSSETWQKVLHKIIETDQITIDPMLEYFEPLYNWLQAENNRLNITVGWSTSKRNVSGGTTTKSSQVCIVSVVILQLYVMLCK